MKYPTNNPDYQTIRLSWPHWLPYCCPLCQAEILFWGSDNGKLVHCVNEIIYQVRNLYRCSDEDCEFFKRSFNPHPRFDYGLRHYGADVFRLIAEKILVFEANKRSIFNELTKGYGLEISMKTLRRIIDDIINLKAWKIDEQTVEILLGDPIALMSFDGQDPGKGGRALWLFFDLLHNRVLFTCIVKSMDHIKLHGIIEEIKDKYNDLQILGFVSDKQNCITKCIEEFYPSIPHQYCQFHFLKHLWDNAEVFDGKVFKPIKKTLNSLYIHTANPNTEVYFESHGKLSVREVFESIDKDLQTMLKVRNKSFKQLRGIWIYDKLIEYIAEMTQLAERMKDGMRFTIIFKKTIEQIKKELSKVEQTYLQARQLQGKFEPIRAGLEDPTRHWLDQQVSLDDIFADIWALALNNGLNKGFDELRSFLPKKDKEFHEILGEYCRLWESYRPGLFQYIHFPIPIKTNNVCENAFSTEKHDLVKEAGREGVSLQIQARGEVYLRLNHCEPWEIRTDIVQNYSDVLVKALKKEQQVRISAVTSLWRKNSKEYLGHKEAVKYFYPEAIEKENNNVE
jgi:hypothetical protein